MAIESEPSNVGASVERLSEAGAPIPADANEAAYLHGLARSHQGALPRSSLWQLANTLVPFVAICALMYWSLATSYLITLALAVLAAGFVVRIFIFQHDCGHGSFFKTRRVNVLVGSLCGVITMAPYALWRRQHAGHHRIWNNLDHRQSGADIYSSCLTVAEYEALSPRGRFLFRAVRHPLVYLVLLPPLVFLLLYRLPFDTPADWRRERRRLHATNLAILVAFLVLGALLGFGRVALVQGPIIVFAAIFGVFLFSLQHRFEQALWTGDARWNGVDAALLGSSYLKLPPILRWFSGNIGYHHIHHLNSGIPNYRLPACAEAIAARRSVPVMGLRQGLSAFRFALWDEAKGRMVRAPRH